MGFWPQSFIHLLHRKNIEFIISIKRPTCWTRTRYLCIYHESITPLRVLIQTLRRSSPSIVTSSISTNTIHLIIMASFLKLWRCPRQCSRSEAGVAYSRVVFNEGEEMRRFNAWGLYEMGRWEGERRKRGKGGGEGNRRLGKRILPFTHVWFIVAVHSCSQKGAVPMLSCDLRDDNTNANAIRESFKRCLRPLVLPRRSPPDWG